MQDNSKCAAVSIQEQLRSVPYEHRHWFSDDPTSHHHIPVGRVCHEAANLLDSQAKELDTLRTHLKALVEAGKSQQYQTPDTVGGYRFLLVYDSGDAWSDDGYCYSREADRIMNRAEAERQFSSRVQSERPELYAMVPIKQFDALTRAIEEAKEKV